MIKDYCRGLSKGRSIETRLIKEQDKNKVEAAKPKLSKVNIGFGGKIKPLPKTS